MYAISRYVLLVLLCSAHTYVYADTDLQKQQQFIRDLINAENQQLQAPQSTQAAVQKHASTKTVNYEGPELSLHALYGVEPRLVAEVTFRGQEYLYLRGQTWPMGDAQGRSQLRLVSLSARCIRVAYKDQHFDACVLPQGGKP